MQNPALATAVGAARAAIKVEPLRESAHASLIRVHLADGNQSEALRVFDDYRTLLDRELDLEPNPGAVGARRHPPLALTFGDRSRSWLGHGLVVTMPSRKEGSHAKHPRAGTIDRDDVTERRPRARH